MTDMLRRLIDFHRQSRELAATRALLAGVPDDMRALHDEHTAAQAGIDALDAAALEARKSRLAAEGAISEAQEKLRHFQQQIPRVRNQREYAALLTEIDTAKADVKRFEEQALTALDGAEKSAAELESRKEEFGDLAQRYAEALAAWEQRKPEVALRARELELEVERLRETLPRGIVAQYQRIAERYHGEALSPLRRAESSATASVWFCSTCNYQVRPQVAVEIHARGAIVQCEGCKRFLVGEGSV